MLVSNVTSDRSEIWVWASRALRLAAGAIAVKERISSSSFAALPRDVRTAGLDGLLAG